MSHLANIRLRSDPRYDSKWFHTDIGNYINICPIELNQPLIKVPCSLTMDCQSYGTTWHWTESSLVWNDRKMRNIYFNWILP